MLTHLKSKGLQAFPYLDDTELMKRHSGQLMFVTDKPNVIVGPNGCGKSALLNTLALRFMATELGVSALSKHYLDDRERLWSRTREWSSDWVFMQGLELVTDDGPMAYYRPHHMPGNEHTVAHAMCMGFWEEARAYARLTEKKSSGQQSQALLDRLMRALSGQGLPNGYDTKRWGAGLDAKTDEQIRASDHWSRDIPYQVERLKDIARRGATGMPVVVMDEPEQSLDARAELLMWKAIEAARLDKVQVIVATHSIYPMLHPERFHIIEGQDGYIESVRSELSLPAA